MANPYAGAKALATANYSNFTKTKAAKPSVKTKMPSASSAKVATSNLKAPSSGKGLSGYLQNSKLISKLYTS
jgi:hypothetical protein